MGVKKKKSNLKRKSTKGLFWFFFLIVGIGTGFYLWYTYAKTNVISKDEIVKNIPQGFSSFGIDVSHHQGKIDWETIFQPTAYDTLIRFVYCKATEGSDHLDTQWQNNRQELNNLGIPNGAYHFFNPLAPPRPQAFHFLNYWKKREVDLPPVLDVEKEGFSDKDLIAKMKIWLTEIEKASGMRPIIYTSLHFYESKFRNQFPGYFFWIAAYSRKPDCLKDPQILHWQYSETGMLTGINERVDLNVSKISF